MVEAIQVTRYRSFDGKDFPTEAEAEAHERANFSTLLVGLTVPQIVAALARNPADKEAVAIANAIERAAYLISQKRRDDGDLRRRPKDKGDAETTGDAGPPNETDREAA